MSALRPSECRTLMEFYQETRTVDTEGGTTTVPGPVADCWGKLYAPSGREAWISDQLRSEVEFMFKTRLNPAVKATHRCNTSDGRNLEVISVMKSDDDPRWMVVALRQYQERTAEAAGSS